MTAAQEHAAAAADYAAAQDWPGPTPVREEPDGDDDPESYHTPCGWSGPRSEPCECPPEGTRMPEPTDHPDYPQREAGRADADEV